MKITYISAVGAAMALMLAATAYGHWASPSRAIPAVQKATRTLLQRPQHGPSTVPITKSIPSGKTIDWLECSSPDCTILTPALKQAAAVLGWKVNVISAGLTPATVKAAWDIAVRDRPDAVMATGFPKSIFASELATLNSNKIPVIDGFTSDPPGNGITAVVEGNNTQSAIGVAQADWVLSQQGTNANTLLLTSSTFATDAPIVAAFKATYKRFCPSCQLNTLDEMASDFGTKLPNDVVGFLRAHPQVNYIAADEGSMVLGLPQALAVAGLKHVNIVTQYPSKTSATYLQQGKYLKALVMYQEIDSMWQMVDALARHFAGMSVAPSERPSPTWLVTPRTVSQLSFPYYLVPNYEKVYKKLWGVKQ